jgi:O-antigen ligase
MFHKLLIAYFGAFLLFWFLGIDQLYFALICAVGFFSYLSSDKSYPGPEVLFFAVFVFCTFFSVVQISTADRYLTYFRNEGVYIAMFFIFVSSTYAAAREGDATDKLYFALLIFSIQCSLVGFLASSGISIAFKSVAGYIIPDVGSKYISGMLNKDSIQAEALWFSQGFYRPRGLMMYPNTMAGILASTMALKAYFIYKFWRDKFKLFALLCLAAIYLDIFSIYSSLSRSTWAGLAVALALFPFVFKTNLRTKLIPVLAGVAIVAFIFFTGLIDGIETRFVEKTHSNEGRGLNYLLIWQETTSSVDKFLFGHGTQIDHWMLDIPLGSHSTYLGVFFKYGVLGLLFFLLFLFYLYRRTLNLTRNVKELNEYGYKYIRPYFLCFALTIPLAQMVFIEVDVDLSYALYFATLVFLIRQESRIVKEKLEAERLRFSG